MCAEIISAFEAITNLYFEVLKTASRRIPKLENRLLPTGERIVFGFVLRLRLFLECLKIILFHKTILFF